MSIIQYINDLSNEWKEVILQYPDIEYLVKLADNEYKLSEQQDKDELVLKVFPEKHNIFRCFKYFSPKNIRVVLIGQDPYHGEGQATGLCFGVNNGNKIPPSLRNISKELENDTGKLLTDFTLEKWAQQGVLLLNSALSVREHTPGSHIKIWSHFTRYILHYLNDNFANKIFVAWGAFAYNCLFNKRFTLDIVKHTLIVSSHPSPLGAQRRFQTYPAFIGSKPFSKINTFLQNNEQLPIEW